MRQLEIFYNSTGETGADLVKFKIRNGSQNHRVLQIYLQRKGCEMSAEVVHNLYEITYGPIKEGSIRRAITDLTGLGLLVKTGKQEAGQWGVKVLTWRAA